MTNNLAFGTEANSSPPTSGQFGFTQKEMTYYEPTLTIKTDGTYSYNTSFGRYDIKQLPILKLWSLEWRDRETNTTIVTKSVFWLLHDTSGSWAPLVAKLTPLSVSATNTRFEAPLNITYPIIGGDVVAKVIFTVTFGRTSLPKIGTQLVRYSYQIDPNMYVTSLSLSSASHIVRFEYQASSGESWGRLGLLDIQGQETGLAGTFSGFVALVLDNWISILTFIVLVMVIIVVWRRRR
jgi:hypothetical protein